MPHSHRRRHRPKRRALTWLIGLACLFVFLVGLVRIFEWLQTNPIGASVLAYGVIALGVIGFVVACCVAGRFGAKLRNLFAAHSAQTDLGRFMRTNPNFRAARDAVHRRQV